jgi:hypothetical protein
VRPTAPGENKLLDLAGNQVGGFDVDVVASRIVP